jgi:probable HAF family extracellular repeat protein
MGPANLLALSTLVLWLSVLPAVHGASYIFTNFDIPGATSTSVSGINDRGHIVGGYTDNLGAHGFIFDGKTVTTIDFPESLGTGASAINNKGHIVGSFTGGDSRSHGFLYKHHQFTVIDAPFPDAGDTLLGGINNRGQIIGESLFINAPTAELSNERGFLFEDQEFQIIPITRPQGINNRGEIVGLNPGVEDGLIYSDGVLTPVSFPGAMETTLLGNNNKGDIVGTYRVSGEDLIHGFVYSKGIFNMLDVPFTDVTHSFPVSLNNKGVIVGVYFIVAEGGIETVRSFLATPKKEARPKRQLEAQN